MTPRAIMALDVAARVFGSPPGDVLANKRRAPISYARWVAIHLLDDAGFPSRRIASEFGIHHSTVQHALEHSILLPPSWQKKLEKARDAFRKRHPISTVFVHNPVDKPHAEAIKQRKNQRTEITVEHVHRLNG